MSRLEINFLALVVCQLAHSVEEYFGRLWDVFPPATFVTSLIAKDRQIGFILINTALIAFGLWCFFWPIRHRWPAARFLIGGWVLIELINGVGHPLWSIQQQRYTPGVITAPLLLILALSLLRQLRKGASAF